MAGILLLRQQLRCKHTYQPGRAGSHRPAEHGGDPAPQDTSRSYSATSAPGRSGMRWIGLGPGPCKYSLFLCAPTTLLTTQGESFQRDTTDLEEKAVTFVATGDWREGRGKLMRMGFYKH